MFRSRSRTDRRFLFPDESFDAVLCNLGLMFFPDPVRGLSEFRRVLRPGRRAAVSVNTVVERSYNYQINVMIALKPEGVGETPQQLVATVMVDDGSADHRPEACHAIGEPFWNAPAMKREVCGSSS